MRRRPPSTTAEKVDAAFKSLQKMYWYAINYSFASTALIADESEHLWCQAMGLLFGLTLLTAGLHLCSAYYLL